jgi:PPOX class probable F420-dependent enzyme
LAPARSRVRSFVTAASGAELRKAERCWAQAVEEEEEEEEEEEGFVTPDEAREFVASNHRAVMVTRRSAGGLQTSPVTVGVDGDGKVVISSREPAYKVHNLRRDPTATLCVFTDDFFGPWVQLEASAEIVPLPEAMDGLID